MQFDLSINTLMKATEVCSSTLVDQERPRKTVETQTAESDDKTKSKALISSNTVGLNRNSTAQPAKWQTYQDIVVNLD